MFRSTTQPTSMYFVLAKLANWWTGGAVHLKHGSLPMGSGQTHYSCPHMLVQVPREDKMAQALKNAQLCIGCQGPFNLAH